MHMPRRCLPPTSPFNLRLRSIPQIYIKPTNRFHHSTALLRRPKPRHRLFSTSRATRMPIGSKDVLLVHLPAPPPKGWHDAVAKRFPQLQVRWEQATFDRENSSIFTADSLPKEVLDGVTMMCLYPPPQPQNMKDVRFMQLISAGSDLWTDHPVYLDKDVQFCSGSGCQPYVHKPCVLLLCLLCEYDRLGFIPFGTSHSCS